MESFSFSHQDLLVTSWTIGHDLFWVIRPVIHAYEPFPCAASSQLLSDCANTSTTLSVAMRSPPKVGSRPFFLPKKSLFDIDVGQRLALPPCSAQGSGSYRSLRTQRRSGEHADQLEYAAPARRGADHQAGLAVAAAHRGSIILRPRSRLEAQAPRVRKCAPPTAIAIALRCRQSPRAARPESHRCKRDFAEAWNNAAS